MTWNCLTLTPNGADDTDAAIELIEVLELKYAEAAKPPGADVFHRRRGDGSHLFYFSPMASALFAEVLMTAGASSCTEPTSDERRIRVRL